MLASQHLRVVGGFSVAMALWLLPSFLSAEEPSLKSSLQAELVDLFAGIESGQLEARVIPRDSTECRLLLTNKTQRPLSVQLPAAFAAVPVLGQFIDWDNQQDNDNASQKVGVGPGQGPWGPQQPPMFNIGNPLQNNRNQDQQGPNFDAFPAFFNLPPETTLKAKMPTVCLEHGKPNPRPKIPYAICPLSEVTQAEGVAEVITQLGQGQVSQRIAQLAAWHLANDKSWDDLASLQKKMAFGKRPQYTEKEIAEAKELVEKVTKPAAAESLSQR